MWTCLGDLKLLDIAVKDHEVTSSVGHATGVVVAFQGLVDCTSLVDYLESFWGLNNDRREVVPLSLGRRRVC